MGIMMWFNGSDFIVEKLLFYRVMPIKFTGYKDVIKDHHKLEQITTEPLSIKSLKEDWKLVDES